MGDIPAWAYKATEPNASFEFPADDGTGAPVGLIVPGSQPAYLWMHVRNPTASPISAHVKVVGTEYPADTAVTRADPLVTYNGQLFIPPGATNDMEAQTCTLPAGMKFTSMTTQTNKLSVHTFVRDGITTVFESTDPMDPGVRRITAAPFLTFASGQISYRCDYANPGLTTVLSGDSVQFDETCIAFGFYFPSTTPRLCYNGSMIP